MMEQARIRNPDSTRLRFGRGLLYVLGGLGLVLGGIVPALKDYPGRNDFRSLYEGAQYLLWGSGQPYMNAGNLYPPGGFLLFAPFAFLSDHAAYIAALLLSAAVYVLAVILLNRRVSSACGRNIGAVFLAVSLLWAPTLAGLHSNNISLLLIALLLILAAYPFRRHRWVGPVIVGCSIAIKPQVSGLFLIYLLARKRWREFAVACCVVIVLTAVGLLLLTRTEPNWLADYRNIQQMLEAPGGGGDISYAQGQRFAIMNLAVALYPLLNSVQAAHLAAIGVGLVLLGVWFAIDLRSRARPNEWLALGALLPICLIPVYQYLYNGSLFVLSLASLLLLRPSRRVWVGMILLCGFLLRTSPFYRRLPPRFLNGEVHSVLWNAFGVGFSAWLTLACVIFMLWIYWKWANGEESERQPQPDTSTIADFA